MLRIIPCKTKDAKRFVAQHHRHHRPSLGALFCLAVADDQDQVRGVAMIGRPVARRLDDGMTCEVTRVATDGARNACSMLLGAARRVAFAMGYSRIYTYTLPEEGGASLRATGWTLDGTTPGRSWHCKRRPRAADAQVLGVKSRWVCRQSKPTRPAQWPAESQGPTLWDTLSATRPPQDAEPSEVGATIGEQTGRARDATESQGDTPTGVSDG